MPVSAQAEIVVRKATAADAAVCGAICYRAFATISGEHNFPCDLPNEEVAVGLMTMMFGHPGFYCVVAESDGRIVGSNCLDERSVIAGVGPITVDPRVQNRGAGTQADAGGDGPREGTGRGGNSPCAGCFS